MLVATVEPHGLPHGPQGLKCFEHMIQASRHIPDAFWNAFECNVADAFWATPLGPKLPSVESGPRLPPEKLGLVAVAAMVAAPPAGAMMPANGMAARTRLRRARAATAAGATAAGGAAIIAAAATTAATTKPDFSDGSIGPDSTDGNLGLNGVAQGVPAEAQVAQ